MLVNNREALTKRWIDYTGVTNEYGVKMVRFEGFGIKRDGTQSSIGVWTCICPRCGQEFQKWANSVMKAKVCMRCWSAPRVPPVSDEERTLTYIYKKYRKHIDKDLELEEFVRYFKHCFMPGTLCKIDCAKPLSLNNWQILPNESITNLVFRNNLRIVEFTAPDGKTSAMSFSTAAEFLGCSRQNVYQLAKHGSLREAIERELKR